MLMKRVDFIFANLLTVWLMGGIWIFFLCGCIQSVVLTQHLENSTVHWQDNDSKRQTMSYCYKENSFDLVETG